MLLKKMMFASRATVDRLPIYYRSLKEALQEGIEIISSEELGRRIGVTPEQIRKDLASFGEFGKKGVGYYVNELKRNIGEILGLHKQWNIAIVGTGHLGWALAHYRNFPEMGFEIKALFDVDPAKQGLEIGGVTIEPINKLAEVIEREKIQIAIVAVPGDVAQEMTNALIAAGVQGIWNFAPVKLVVPDDISIVNADLSAELATISYQLLHREESQKV